MADTVALKTISVLNREKGWTLMGVVPGDPTGTIVVPKRQEDFGTATRRMIRGMRIYEVKFPWCPIWLTIEEGTLIGLGVDPGRLTEACKEPDDALVSGKL